MTEVGIIMEISNIDMSCLPASSRVYVREESWEIWNVLYDVVSSNSRIITGYPGIGKSTEIFRWVENKRNTCKILWIHYSMIFGISCTSCLLDRFIKYNFESTINENLKAFIPELVRIYRIQVLVCGGFRKESNMPSFCLSCLIEKCIVVYFSSYNAATEIKGGEEALLGNWVISNT
jgi:hypothetical protein